MCIKRIIKKIFESKKQILTFAAPIMLFRPDGGIGRRAGLKHQWIHFHAGSTPAPGTLAEKLSEMAAFLFLFPSKPLLTIVKTFNTSLTSTVRQPVFPKISFLLNNEPNLL